MTATQQCIAKFFAALVPQFDVPLAPFTYMKIGGVAEVFLEISTEAQFLEVAARCRAEKIPITILGGASNVLISDAGLRGVVIHFLHQEGQVITTDSEKKVLRFFAGSKTALAVKYSVDQGCTGLEPFLGVPGTIGGAVMNNAHYLSHLIAEHILQVRVCSLDNTVSWLNNSACDFAYDHSRFQTSGEVILFVDFLLSKGNLATSQKIIKDATLFRAQTQPLGEPSSGCYFQNVPNSAELRQQFPQYSQRADFPTAFLIDLCGLKGQREGDIEVSQKNAAFLINTGHGTSHDVQQLAARIKEKVYARFGIRLQEEVILLRTPKER